MRRRQRPHTGGQRKINLKQLLEALGVNTEYPNVYQIVMDYRVKLRAEAEHPIRLTFEDLHAGLKQDHPEIFVESEE